MSSEDHQQVVRQTARHNAYAGIALMALASFLFYRSYWISLDFVDEEGIGPRFFPQAICVAFGLIGLTLTITGFQGKATAADKSDYQAVRFFADAVPMFLLGIGFVLLFGAFGYVMACLPLIFTGLWAYGVRNIKTLIVMPVITTTILYLIFFKLMAVFEPVATIFNPLALLGLK